MTKLTKAQQRLYDRVKAEGAVLVRELSAAENKTGHKLKDMGLLELDGLISSRGPFNELAKVAGISPATAHRFKAGKAVDIPTARKLMSAGFIKECPCCGRKALSGGEDGN